MARPISDRPISPPPSLSPITGSTPTERPSPATSSAPASRARAMAAVRDRLSLRRGVGERRHALCGGAGAGLPYARLQRNRPLRRRLRVELWRHERHRYARRTGRSLRHSSGREQYAGDLTRSCRLGARLGQQSRARRHVPVAARRGLHGQRRGAAAEFRARLGRRQILHHAGLVVRRQVRRRIRRWIADLCRHRNAALRVVSLPGSRRSNRY